MCARLSISNDADGPDKDAVAEARGSQLSLVIEMEPAD
jgi:hypothetical protein